MARCTFSSWITEANYCVIRKNRQFCQELLERTAAEIVRATDALAEQETEIFLRANGSAPRNATARRLFRLYVPVIVTTAKLYICDADYTKIDLAEGQLGALSSAKVHFVRFTKSLGFGQAAAVAYMIRRRISQGSAFSALTIRRNSRTSIPLSPNS